MKKALPLIVGIIFLAVGIFLFIQNKNLTKNCTVEATATVISMKEEINTDSDGTRYMYYPIIQYEVNGKIVEATMNSGSSNPAYKINEKVNILYNPNNTKQFIVKGDKSSFIFSIVFAGLGAVITVYGFVVLLKKDYQE